jgi:membrane associated rhomboid family serine protease
MRSASDALRARGGRLPAPATVVLAAVLVAVYFGFQGGGIGLGPQRGIEFRCNAVEYGLIPYEVTHPGQRLTDPFCQPQSAAPDDGHDHPRSDPGIEADAPTWLTVVTSTFMNGGLLPLAAGVVFLAMFGPRLERRLGAARFLAVFLLAGLATSAALVAIAPNLPIVTLIGAAGAVGGVIGANVVLLRGSLTLVGAWVAVQVAVFNLDAAQPVAGEGGDVAYLVPAAGLLVGLLAAIPRLAPEVLSPRRPTPRRAARSSPPPRPCRAPTPTRAPSGPRGRP